MKYLPLVWAAFRRHTTESWLTLLVLTIAFTLFSSMLALKATYEQAITVNRMDRLLVTARFCCQESSIARRDEMSRMPGVRGVAALGWVFGFHREPSMPVGITMLDEASIAAIPSFRSRRSTGSRWRRNARACSSTRTEAANWNVKVGDVFPVQTRPGSREDGATAWPFEVLGIVDDPAAPLPWTPNLFGNYEYFEAARTPAERGTVRFIVAIDDPDQAETLCQQIDTRYANSVTPTACVPLQVDARNIVESVISMRQMSLGIAGAGLFMILFLSANGTAESVRERIPEFAVLKTVGFSDRRIAALVFLEAALPCIAGAVLGTGLAAALSTFTARLDEETRSRCRPRPSRSRSWRSLLASRY